MLTSEELSALSIQEMAQTIETHHEQTSVLYASMASKVVKRTTGDKTMSDDKVNVAEYWLKVANDQRKILSMDFDLQGFEESVIPFRFMSDLITENGSLSVQLKTARDIASSDCFYFCSIVRKAVQAKEKDPVFALILEKEPSPRQTKKKKLTTTVAESKTETTETKAV